MLTQFVLLPLYIYPSSGAWDSLTATITKYPNLLFTLVVDPADGPGSGAYPDSNWIAGISKLNSYANTQLLGYVHTVEATRPFSDVVSDIDQYAKWSRYRASDIHMDGIFFDESPSTCGQNACSYMANATARVTSKLGAGRDYTVFNAGVHSNVLVDAGLYALANTIIVFEDYYSELSAAKVKAIPSAFRSKSAFIVHDFNGGSKAGQQAVDMVVGGGIPGLYITSDSDYDTWPSNWAQFTKSMSTTITNSNQKSASVAGSTSSVGIGNTKRSWAGLGRLTRGLL